MDREEYTRVTQVLYPFSGLDKIDPDVVARAADRGTRVHNICEGIIKGLGEFGVESDTEPYVESFKKWWDQGHEVEVIEERFWDDELQITGKVDLILKIDDGFAIADLKTSSKHSPTWEAQGSAYAYLARKSGYNIQKILFIHLLKSGKAPKIYEYPVDESFFINTLKVWKHFFKRGNL